MSLLALASPGAAITAKLTQMSKDLDMNTKTRPIMKVVRMLEDMKEELNKVHPEIAASDAESKEQAKRIESLEGDKRDDLSGNKWFKNSEMLAGNKKFIHNKAEWAWHNNVTCANYGCYAQWSATQVAIL